MTAYEDLTFKRIAWAIFGISTLVLTLVILFTPIMPPYAIVPKDEIEEAFFIPMIPFCSTALVGGVCFFCYKGAFYQSTNNDQVYLLKADDDSKPARRTAKVFLIGFLISYFIAIVLLAGTVKVLFIADNKLEYAIYYNEMLATEELYIRLATLCFCTAVIILFVYVAKMYNLQLRYWKKSFENIKMRSYQDCIDALASKPVEVDFLTRVKYFFKILTFDSSVLKKEDKEQMLEKKKTAQEKKEERKRLKEERRKAKIDALTVREDYSWNKKE